MSEETNNLRYGNTASIANRFYANFIYIVIALLISAVIFAVFIRNDTLNEILVPLGFFHIIYLPTVLMEANHLERKYLRLLW